MKNQSETEKAYWSGVACWAQGGSIRDLDAFLRASHRTLARFGRDVREHQVKISAGQAPAKMSIRAVPAEPTIR
jgi:hypothetical protein